jgi:hypothetical protein
MRSLDVFDGYSIVILLQYVHFAVNHRERGWKKGRL